jgi:hypothetical protein
MYINPITMYIEGRNYTCEQRLRRAVTCFCNRGACRRVAVGYSAIEIGEIPEGVVTPIGSKGERFESR